MIMKEVLFVAGAAALGEYMRGKFGASIEKAAIDAKIPPQVAHIAMVGGAAAVGFVVLRAVF